MNSSYGIREGFKAFENNRYVCDARTSNSEKCGGRQVIPGGVKGSKVVADDRGSVQLGGLERDGGGRCFKSSGGQMVRAFFGICPGAVSRILDEDLTSY